MKKDNFSEGINVLSLFNGMSTGHLALENLGIKVNNYYSSEIKPDAIKLVQHHYPKTIQLGDVTKWKEWNIDWSKIDLLLSGSPCKDLSIAGKRKGIFGENSGLFWVFIDILNHIKKLNPNIIFLQENVGSAPKKDIGIMSRALGVYPILINSSLLTAQLRSRYYWTNSRTKEFGMFGDLVTDIPQPEDKKIMFKDILENGYTDINKCNCILESESRLNTDMKKHYKRYKEKSHSGLVYVEKEEVRVKTNTVKGFDVLTENDCLNLSFPTSTTRRGRVTKGKSPCLLAGNEPLYSLQNYNVRILSQLELERLQGFPDYWTSILTRNKAASLLGDAWTLPVIEHIFSFLPFKKSVGNIIKTELEEKISNEAQV
jgi:DNA (cytosine-5)-methyltransferase 3A